MRKLPKPAFSVDDIVDDCVRSLQSTDLKTRLRNAKPTITAAAHGYNSRGALGELYLIAGGDAVDEVSAVEMEKLYKQTFVKSKRTRPIYASLKKACRNDICPLCGQRTVHQLDHYLPVSRHPVLAVTPVNLVPACSECNKVKLAHGPANAKEQTLHPYFDDLTDVRWLFADVEKTQPVSMVFRASPTAGLSPVVTVRITGHFDMFNLGDLYASHAAEELSNIRYGLDLVASGIDAANDLRAHLQREAQSRSALYRNSWQTAMYEELAQSDWFCNGGYRQIG
jgi:hypothetical protein